MLPEPFRGLVDDAAVFPPGDAPLPEALAAYVGRRGEWYADLVASFVVTDVALPEVTEAVPVSVVVTGGAGAIAGALKLAAKRDLTVAGLEIALRDPDDLPGNARRVSAAVDAARSEGALDEDTPVYVELPQTEASAVLAGRRRRGRRGRAPAEVPHRRPRGRPVPDPGDAGRLDRRGARPRDAVQVHGRAAPRHRAPRPRDRLRPPRLPQRAARDPAGLRRRVDRRGGHAARRPLPQRPGRAGPELGPRRRATLVRLVRVVQRAGAARRPRRARTGRRSAA